MSLTTEEQCYLQTIIIPGSNLYYATRFLPEKFKAKQLPLYALHEILSAIPDECSDPGVARIKLHWWHDQLQNLNTQSVQHPLIKLLAKSSLNSSASKDAYDKLIHNTLTKLDCYFAIGSHQSAASENTYSRGVLTKTLAAHENIPENTDFTLQLAQIIDISEMILQIGKDKLRKVFRIHPELVSQYCADATANNSQVLHAAIAETILAIKTQIKKLTEQYQSSQSLYSALTGEWIYCHLLLKTLSLAENNYCEILQQHISLTPIRKLWISFRHSK